MISVQEPSISSLKAGIHLRYIELYSIGEIFGDIWI